MFFLGKSYNHSTSGRGKVDTAVENCSLSERRNPTGETYKKTAYSCCITARANFLSIRRKTDNGEGNRSHNQKSTTQGKLAKLLQKN